MYFVGLGIAAQTCNSSAHARSQEDGYKLEASSLCREHYLLDVVCRPFSNLLLTLTTVKTILQFPLCIFA